MISRWSSFWLGAACAWGLSLVTDAKAACIEESAAILNCSSTAPMPTSAPRQIIVITGDQPTALQVQNGNDQTLRDNRALAQQQADWQRYLDDQARLARRVADGW